MCEGIGSIIIINANNFSGEGTWSCTFRKFDITAFRGTWHVTLYGGRGPSIFHPSHEQLCSRYLKSTVSGLNLRAEKLLNLAACWLLHCSRLILPDQGLADRILIKWMRICFIRPCS